MDIHSIHCAVYHADLCGIPNLEFSWCKKGTVSVCIYFLLGLIGLPVFANFNSGVGALFGLTGGYMIGWLFSGLIMWLMEKLIGKKLWAQAVSLHLQLDLPGNDRDYFVYD